MLEAMRSNFFHGKNVAFIGLCGGQASGKTQIANYFQKNIPGSAIIAERDFFKIGKTNRKMSSSDEPLVGDVDGYDPERKNLLIQLSNPEFYDHDKLINCLEKLAKSEVVDIPYYDVILGCEKEVVLPNKEKIKVKIPKCSSDGKQITVHDKGLNHGNYILVINVTSPTAITSKEEKLLGDIKKLHK